MSIGHRIEEDPSIAVLLADASESDIVGCFDAENGDQLEGLLGNGEGSLGDDRPRRLVDGHLAGDVIDAIGIHVMLLEATITERHLRQKPPVR